MSRPDIIEVDLSAVSSKRELHEALARALGFPGWYGHNWAAFWDAITGLVAMPVALRLVGWGGFETQMPAEARTLRDLLSDMATQYPEHAPEVVYAE